MTAAGATASGATTSGATASGGAPPPDAFEDPFEGVDPAALAKMEAEAVLWAFAHVYIFLRKRSPTSVRPASAARDRQSQSNLFRPDLFCLSVSIFSLKCKNFRFWDQQNVIFLVRFADFARTCAVIVNVPDLKAYSSVAAKLLRRVTSYARL